MSQRGKRWKSVKLDFNTLSTYDDEEYCHICLTPRQAAALLGYMRGMSWVTRWENLPVDFDLSAWVADIEDRLINMSCSCGNSSANTACLCRIENLLNIMISTDYPSPVIPPNDPGANVPGVDPTLPAEIAKRDAILCEVSQIIMSTIFDNMRQAVLAQCNGDNPLEEFGEFAQSAGSTSMNFYLAAAGISVAIGSAAFLPVLGAAALATGLFASAGAVLSWNPFGIGEQCADPGGVPEEILIAYSCQLYKELIITYNFETFRNALNTANSAAIAYYQGQGMTVGDATLLDEDQRNVISNYLAQGNLFQLFTITLGDIVEDPYIEPSECSNCIDCSDSSFPLQTLKFDDPMIISITPPRDLEDTSTQLGWSVFPDEVVFTFARPVCVNNFKFVLVRGATVSLPKNFIWFVGISSKNSSAGGFGDNSENEGFGFYGRELRLSAGDAGSAAATLRLQLPNASDGIVIRDVNPS